MMHVMVDLETFGLCAGDGIVSIGAVAFDPMSDTEPPYAFYAIVDPHSCEEHGLGISLSTLKWWFEQDASVQEALFHKNAVSLPLALAMFHDWFKDVDGDFMWSQGNMDPTVLEHAYKQTKLPVPWWYSKTEDTRTAYNMANLIAGFNYKDVERTGVYHNAYSDAVHQAKCIQAAFASLMKEDKNED